MIIYLLLQLLYELLDLLLIFEIPKFPAEAINYISQGFEYIIAGGAIVNNYLPLDYALFLFSLILVIDLAICIYKFIMWLIKKVPMLGIG